MLNTGGMIGAGAYLLSLLFIGAIARRASREASLKDYYLAGGSLGVASLFFTLYATQYSGNTLFGVPGQAYREGFSALAVTFAVMGIVAVYAIYAPALHDLGRRHRFVTAGDYVRWRFDDRRLTFTANLIFVFTLTSYILANLKAMGLLVEGATGGAVSYVQGILLLSLVMAVYESLGGMRSVVWTDVLQGSILLLGCLIVFTIVWRHPDMGVLPPAELAQKVADTFGDRARAFEFVGLLLLVAIGAAVYPQAIQRIYAARNAAALRTSFSLLLLMPLLVMLPLSIVAMSAARWLPAIPVAESESVILRTIAFALADSGQWAGVLAIVLPQSIWALMVIKFELLVQVAPTIVLGIRLPGLRPQSLLVGVVAGCATALAFRIIRGYDNPLGIHAGLWGLGVNLTCIALVHSLSQRPAGSEVSMR